MRELTVDREDKTLTRVTAAVSIYGIGKILNGTAMVVVVYEGKFIMKNLSMLGICLKFHGFWE